MQKLFGNNIPAQCRYCELAYPGGDDDMMLCSKKGMVKAEHSCRAYRYDPLSRTPRRPLELEKHEAEEFAL